MVPRFESVFLAVPWEDLLTDTRRQLGATCLSQHQGSGQRSCICSCRMRASHEARVTAACYCMEGHVEISRRMVDVYRKQVWCIPTRFMFRICFGHEITFATP